MILFGISQILVNKEIGKIIKIWGKGNIFLSKDKEGNVKNFISADAIAYTIGYVRKKAGSGKDLEKYYNNIGRVAPFKRQSQGIGKDYCMKNMDNWTQVMSFRNNNKDLPIPRAYIKWAYEEEGFKVRYKSYGGNYSYKIFKDLDGIYTSRILLTKYNNIGKSINSIKLLNILNNDEIIMLERNMVRFNGDCYKNDIMLNRELRLNGVKVMLKKLEMRSCENKNRYKKSKLCKPLERAYYKWLSNESISKLKEYNSHNEYVVKNSPYGNRLKYEIGLIGVDERNKLIYAHM